MFYVFAVHEKFFYKKGSSKIMISFSYSEERKNSEFFSESTNENIILNENSIELRRSTAELFYEHSGEQSGDKSDYSVLYTAHFKNILLRPNTLHAATWADNRRLFMCKIQANLSHNLGLSFCIFKNSIAFIYC